VNVSLAKFPYNDEQYYYYCTLFTASQKLGISGTCKLVLEDGTEIDNDDALQYCLENEKILTLLRKGEKMTTAGGIFTAEIS